MRMMLTLILIAAAGWSGYWYLGSTGVHAGFESWFNARRAEGWAADYSAMNVRGYPNRFDTTFSDIMLADPETGLAWEAPFFQLFALSYKPNHLIAIWPDQQRMSTPAEKYDITSRNMRASVILGTEPRLPLERATLTAESLSASPQNTITATRMKALTLAVEHMPESMATYRFGVAADDFSPALRWKDKVDPDGNLPTTLDALSADLTVTFDKPWDRTALEEARPQPTEIKIKLAEARWGQLELQAAGRLSIGADGVPEGEITLKARNWRDILRLAVAAGALPPSLAEPVEDGLALIAQLAGNPETLDFPLDFHNGRVSLGPVPIAAAPVLTLR